METLSSKDIALWQAYDKLFPFGQQHTDYLLAQMIAVCFNLWKSKETPSITANDVLGKNEVMSEDYVLSTIKGYNNGTN